MREHDAPTGVERARRRVVNKQVVGVINISCGDVVRPDTPVVRVVFPYDSHQAHPMCNGANAVLQEKAKWLVIAIFRQMGNKMRTSTSP